MLEPSNFVFSLSFSDAAERVAAAAVVSLPTAPEICSPRRREGAVPTGQPCSGWGEGAALGSPPHCILRGAADPNSPKLYPFTHLHAAQRHCGLGLCSHLSQGTLLAQTPKAPHSSLRKEAPTCPNPNPGPFPRAHLQLCSGNPLQLSPVPFPAGPENEGRVARGAPCPLQGLHASPGARGSTSLFYDFWYDSYVSSLTLLQPDRLP